MTTMTSTIESSWQAIQSITQNIEAETTAENWAYVSELALQRHQIIRSHFDDFPVGPATASFYSTTLSSFLQKEDNLNQLIKAARKQALKDGSFISNRKKINASYQLGN